MNVDASANIKWQWEILEEVDSTNRVALERTMARWGTGERAEGLAFLARRQTTGRGQHGRRWESPAGGLYMSLVVENVPVGIRGRLALLAGVAVVEAVREVCGEMPLKIRWPNDVLLGGKKLAGILCEAVAQGERWAAVVGIGVNVNSRVAELPAELREAATSLFEVDQKVRSVEELAKGVALRLDRQVQHARTSGLAEVVGAVRLLDALRGEAVRLAHRGMTVKGIGAGIGDDGALLLRLGDGEAQSFSDGTLHVE